MMAEKREKYEKSGKNDRSGETASSDAVVFSVCPVPCSARPIVYDDSVCIGCGRCAEVCQVDVLVPSAGKGRHPLVMFPGECYYCGSCVMECPVPGAIRLVHPLMNQAKFVPVRSGKKT